MPAWTLIETDEEGRAMICEPLARSGLPHLFTLRPSADCGPSRSIPRSLLDRVGLADIPFARPAQVHGCAVAVPAEDGARTTPEEADAVAVTARGVGGAIATADCVGAILHDPETGAFAVVHAGWRGTLARVVPAAVRSMQSSSGTRPDRIVMAMGPAIRGCCYVVGEEVAEAFRGSFAPSRRDGLFGDREGRTTIDLVAANRLLAMECGIARASIHDPGLCTSCRPDLCWSFRRAGAGAGRMWTLAGRPA